MITLEELTSLIFVLLTQAKPPERSEMDERLFDDPTFCKLYDNIMDLRDLSRALNSGDLQKMVRGRGYILANLKALQSNLRHLTWQTNKIADGDFTQTVDFLGEFSKSFNEMTIKLRDATENLIKSASVDALTKIPNRSTLEKFAAQAFSKAKASASNMCILMFDIDHFKRINDTYGHDAGDETLRQFAESVSVQFRSSDCFGRYGGEEFLAILPNVRGEVVLKIAQRCLEMLRSQKIRISDTLSLSITASIGFSSITSVDTNYEQIVKRADLAMYEAKSTGRDRICVK